MFVLHNDMMVNKHLCHMSTQETQSCLDEHLTSQSQVNVNEVVKKTKTDVPTTDFTGSGLCVIWCTRYLIIVRTR